jgi:eukaryotic-like serine/threonine-protein kinase
MSAADPLWPQARRILRDLRGLDEVQRASALAALETESPELANYVRRLLLAARDEDQDLLGAIGHAASLEASDPDLPPADARIGPWTLESRLGSGGMGEVWRACREQDGFRQQAALKLLKRGMDSEALLRRFMQERRILARLEHPGIARMLDGGMAADGRPWLAMELVEGQPIDAFVATARPSLKALLRLFLDICEAVDFAHRSLVVHRDLKPSNILVDTQGRPRLLDFGIAKLIGEESEDSTLTSTQMRVLTPAYAAPEQILGEPATTATDVYALGVILYELLTGTLPHARGSRTPEAMASALHDAPITRPSAALRRASGDQATRTRTLRLAREVQGDLDAIILTALRIDPSRRYPGAAAMADDLRRFLDGRPVSARPDTLGYRLRRFVVRHRTGVAAGTAMVLALLIGLGTALWQAQQTAAEARRAEAVKTFLVDLFEVSDPDARPGEEISARDLLQAGVERIRTQFGDQPLLKRELLVLLGRLTARLGDLQVAADLFGEALTIDRRLGNTGDIEHGDLHVHLGEAFRALSEHARSREHLAEAVATLRPLAVRSHEAQRSLAHALALAGNLETQANRFEPAEAFLEEALAISRTMHPHGIHPDVARDLRFLGVLRFHQGDYEGSAKHAREVLPMMESLYGRRSSHYAAALQDYAVVLGQRAMDREASPLYDEALAIRRELLGDDHPLTIQTLRSSASSLRHQGRLAEIEPDLNASLVALRHRLGVNHPDVADIHTLLAFIAADRGDFEAAHGHNSETVRIYESAFGTRHQRTALARSNGSSHLRALGRLDEALQEVSDAHAALRELLGDEHLLYGVVTSQLAQTLLAMEDFQEANARFAEGVPVFESNMAPGNPRVVELRLHWAEALLGMGDAKEALDMLDALATTLADKLAPDHALHAAHAHTYGRALWIHGRVDEALQSAQFALDARCDEETSIPRPCAQSRVLLADVLATLGRHEEAAAFAAHAAPVVLADLASPPHIRRSAKRWQQHPPQDSASPATH